MRIVTHQGLSRMCKAVEESVQNRKAVSITETIGFFDLHGSTPLKFQDGHTKGLDHALRFTIAAASVVSMLGGRVVKELGDGVLCRFPDPLDGIFAVLNLKALCQELAIVARFGLTIGRISCFTSDSGGEDIMGAAVDRCFRIQSLCSPGQVLVDQPLFEIVKTHLAESQQVVVGRTFVTEAKGIGVLELHEISTKDLGLVDRLMTPFAIYPEGRLSIEDKVRFMQQAEREFLEIGIGLTAFAKYFTGQRPAEFRNHVKDLLSRGVCVKCYAVDPQYGPVKAYLEENEERQYRRDLTRARELILAQRKRFLAMGCPATLQYFSYKRVPSFHCICVDGSEPLNARMLISPYVPGLQRAECPVYQLSRLSSPDLFTKYWTAITEIQSHSTEIES